MSVDELKLLVSRFSDWATLVDVALVALVFYGLLRLIRGTRAIQVLRGILVIALAIALITSFLELTAFSWLLRVSTPAILVAIPVIFQPELRRALEQLGRTTPLFGRQASNAASAKLISEVVQAVEVLGDRRHGALIVFEGQTGLQEHRETGVPVDAQVSSRLLLTIFFPGTALHDGAVFIRGDRLVAAACVLPLATGKVLDPDLGTRHMAAIGVTEQSDALTIVVSEETGIVSAARNGRMVRRLDRAQLRKILQAFFQT